LGSNVPFAVDATSVAVPVVAAIVVTFAPVAEGAPSAPQASSYAAPSETYGAFPPAAEATAIVVFGSPHDVSQGQHDSGKIEVEPAAARDYLRCLMKPGHPGASC
jgi:hypothetical protein